MNKNSILFMFASSCLLPSHAEELGRQGTKCHQTSALDAVLSLLCPSHCSLLYQILKLAQQENLLLFLNHKPIGQTESHCCHCGITLDNNATPNIVPFSECKALESSPHYPLTNCNGQGHDSTVCHPGDYEPNSSIHHYSLTNCKSGAQRASCYCCLQTPGMEMYTVLCPKRLHFISCHSLAVGNSDSVVCSFASSSNSSLLCNDSSSLRPSSLICCNQYNLQSYPCHSNYVNLAQVRNTLERVVREMDPPCPVLKREQSPSPPPLSPIQLDTNKKSDEKPPSLFHHRQEEEADLVIRDDLLNLSDEDADIDKATKEEQECRTPTASHTERNPNGTLLQDVMNRFSEKLETITPVEKDTQLDPTALYVSENKPPSSPSTRENFHADAHLNKIITTVLDTGSASDYNLNELFSRQDNKEPKSPNTRLRRRQEVLAAIATPTNDCSSRRHTLQIKRELAMFDPSHTKKKVPPSKRTKLKDENSSITTPNTCSNLNVTTEEPIKEIEMSVELEPSENNRGAEGPLNTLMAESGRDKVEVETQIVVATEEFPDSKIDKKESEVSNDEKEIVLVDSQIPTPEPQSKMDNQCSVESLQTQEMSVTTTSAKPRGRPRKECVVSNSAKRDRNNESTDSDGIASKSSGCPSKEARKSRRNIVPPQRFSSFVTESRKMYFVACFSENIFNKKIQNDKTLTGSTMDAISQEPESKETHLKPTSEIPPTTSPEHRRKFPTESALGEKSDQFFSNQILTQTVTTIEKSPAKHSSDNRADSSGATFFGRLRLTPKRLQDLQTTSEIPKNTANMDIAIKFDACVGSHPSCHIQYTSPIKLMFATPVKDKEGVRYSLKSAGSGSRGEPAEAFDPCEESSWSGTLQKNESQNTESSTQTNLVSSSSKSVTSPASSPKTASPPSRSASSPPSEAASSPPHKTASSSPSKSASPVKPTSKSASSPGKYFSPSMSLRSASSSPRISPRRSGEGTPTKRGTGSETQRSTGDLISYAEMTPPKRRPGRPKKLGPQLEQKVKRPIGRPRKLKNMDSVIGANRISGKFDAPSDIEENVNKNLKITVVYGRSRRNKRTVSEGFGQLQTEFHDACQSSGHKRNLGILFHNCSSGTIQTSSTEAPEESNFVSPVNESASQASSNIKRQKQSDSVPIRKPGRPAKVKISGISVTVTTVSPRQRKIQINNNTRQSQKTVLHTKVLQPQFKSAKEPLTICCQSTGKIRLTEDRTETKDERKLSDRPVAVRHSVRVRKPSIHFLHAVATSNFRSYSHSNALLRRSKQLLLNKASNERKQAVQENSVEDSGVKKQVCGQRRQNISVDLSRVARVSVDSIFSPKETLKWWAVSAEQRTMNQELARRIRLISDTWVSDALEHKEKEIALNSKGGRESEHCSVVRALFDCSPNKPRSCSMQQLCSWFMQTTETQSLAIVKKTSSRNPYEFMHFPRSGNKKSICHSPQAQRLRKHIKKFAKTVPKSPLQHQRMQRRLKNEARRSTHVRRQLFSLGVSEGRLDYGAPWRSNRAFCKYQATLCRAMIRFLKLKDRNMWQKRQRNRKDATVATSPSNEQLVMGLKRKALRSSTKHCLENSPAINSVNLTQEPVDILKEQNLCSKAWSPETLKECRVFLRKINSPDSKSTEEEWDSCTVTLDDGSPSAHLVAGRKRELAEVFKAVKTERKLSMNRTASKELAGSAPVSVKEQDTVPVQRQNGKYKSPGVVSSDPLQPPPAKTLRQSRMRGLTGPRWCDFVFGNYLASFLEYHH